MIAFFVTIISEIYFRKEATKYFSKFMICLLSSKVNNSANSWKTPKGKFSYNYNLAPSLPPKIKILLILAKIAEKNKLKFLAVRYFTWKVKFVSNILSMIIPGNNFLLLTSSRSLQTWNFGNFSNCEVLNTVST